MRDQMIDRRKGRTHEARKGFHQLVGSEKVLRSSTPDEFL
jgi:hypothetical protein